MSHILSFLLVVTDFENMATNIKVLVSGKINNLAF